MNAKNFAARMRQAQRANDLSAEKAKLLTTIGMPVKVRLDNDAILNTATASLPWQLGHGAWVVLLKSEIISGGYDCGRVTPAESEVAS